MTDRPEVGSGEELWLRPGLDRRSRRLATLACVSGRGALEPLREQVCAALDGGEVAVDELREAVLHLAVYGGWPLASQFDQVVAEEARRRGAAEWRPTAAGVPERSGAEEFELVNCRPARAQTTPLYEAVLGFVFGQVWQRPLLGRRDRRILSLVSAGLSGAEVPVRAHVEGALRSGDLDAEEIREVVLHVAAYGTRAAALGLAAALEAEAARS